MRVLPGKHGGAYRALFKETMQNAYRVEVNIDGKRIGGKSIYTVNANHKGASRTRHASAVVDEEDFAPGDTSAGMANAPCLLLLAATAALFAQL